MRQFLDIGTGIPTAGNTHEVAQSVAPEARVVYVDCDPIVLAHARALLTSSEAGVTGYIEADLRDTGTIIAQAGRLLDFTRPVAVTLLAILHVIPDSDDPHAIVTRLLDAVPSGSYLALTHVGTEFFDVKTRQKGENIGRRMSQEQVTTRGLQRVARFFKGADLVEPGIVRAEEWRPDRGTAPRPARPCGARSAASADAVGRVSAYGRTCCQAARYDLVAFTALTASGAIVADGRVLRPGKIVPAAAPASAKPAAAPKAVTNPWLKSAGVA